MTSIRNISKISFKALLIAVFCLVATSVAEAKTISQSSSFIDSSTRDYFNDVYEREDYKYSILASEYVTNTGYTSITYYYLCLTDDKPDVSSTSSLQATCSKLYRYYRNNSIYVIDQLNDNELRVSNAIYYFSDNKHYLSIAYLFILVVILSLFMLYIVIRDLFR